jgi:hypothetical protein
MSKVVVQWLLVQRNPQKNSLPRLFQIEGHRFCLRLGTRRYSGHRSETYTSSFGVGKDDVELCTTRT